MNPERTKFIPASKAAEGDSLRFQRGEVLPWKGVQFKVESIEEGGDKLTLRATGRTGKRGAA